MNFDCIFNNITQPDKRNNQITTHVFFHAKKQSGLESQTGLPQIKQTLLQLLRIKILIYIDWWQGYKIPHCAKIERVLPYASRQTDLRKAGERLSAAPGINTMVQNRNDREWYIQTFQQQRIKGKNTQRIKIKGFGFGNWSSQQTCRCPCPKGTSRRHHKQKKITAIRSRPGSVRVPFVSKNEGKSQELFGAG